MKKIQFVVREKDGNWATKETNISARVKIDISIKRPAVDVALQDRTGLKKLPF